MPRLILTAGAIVAVAFAIGRHEPAHAQSRATILAVTSDADRRAWTGPDAMTRTGELERRREDADFLLPGRTHERFAQRYKGVPVYGGDVTRQTNAGTTVSLFGTMYNGIDMAVDPALTVDAALAVIKRESGVDLGTTRAPQLMILPIDGQYRLVYHAKTFSDAGAFEYFIDANSGAVVRRLDAAQRQSARVGTGTGVLGDTKKLSVNFRRHFRRRRAEAGLFTFDMRGNLTRMNFILNGAINPSLSDPPAAATTFERSGRRRCPCYAGCLRLLLQAIRRRGLTTRISRCGVCASGGAVAGGVGPHFGAERLLPQRVLRRMASWFTAKASRQPGGWQHVDYFGRVGHRRPRVEPRRHSLHVRLIYQNEPVLSTTFSDMMGTSIEFYYSRWLRPLRADYSGRRHHARRIRSLSNPATDNPITTVYGLVTVRQPTPRQWRVHTTRHRQSFYYLAIEGGVNRTSGLTVQGVGARIATRSKVIYRAFTQMMPSNATWRSHARSPSVCANFSAPERSRARNAAWTAVGVN